MKTAGSGKTALATSSAPSNCRYIEINITMMKKVFKRLKSLFEAARK